MKSLTQTLTVETKHAASQLGSGFLEVFATPAMVAFMENTAAKVIDDLDEGSTSVGIEIHVKHLKASKIGEVVTCAANLKNKDGRIYEFDIEVTDSKGDIIGTAAHKRAVVDVEKFMKKLGD